jgi:methylenetetrahydrofolate dehydrogenase (NADP+)/methenyltetrahydrofolate cyclohydrolase
MLLYLKAQERLAKKLNIDFRPYSFKKNTKASTLVRRIKELNRNKSVQGVIINKPLPLKGSEYALFCALAPTKDIEGITPYNLGMIFLKQPCFLPPTVLSVLEIIKISGVDLWGKDTVIVGFSTHIGKPLSILLADQFSSVSITHIATFQKKKLACYIKNADVVISCVGKPFLIKGDWIKKRSLIIDVGIAKYKGTVCGDVEFEAAREKAAYITPVPGGVGLLTKLFLFKNLLKAKKQTL